MRLSRGSENKEMNAAATRKSKNRAPACRVVTAISFCKKNMSENISKIRGSTSAIVPNNPAVTVDNVRPSQPVQEAGAYREKAKRRAAARNRMPKMSRL